jgi:hypothetical protein
VGAYYSAGTTLRVSFSVTALCAAAGTGALCASATVQSTAATTLAQNLDFYFGVVTTASSPTSSNVVTAATGATGETRTGIGFGITDVNPTTTCSGVATDLYFPGDSQIYLYASNITASKNGGVDLQYLITMAKDNAAAAGDAIDFEAGGVSSNSIVHYTPSSASTEEITGFTNATGADHKYAVIVQAQNKVGLVSEAASKCSFFPAQSQDISGILKESKCFIATAAYHDGRAAPVMMLRKFRDQILSQFSLGREFIKTYYQYSPAAAEWAWDKPIIRSVALKLLAPVELMAWAILKITSAEEVTAPVSNQPYIDRLKKELPPESADSSASGSYIDQEKKKLEESQPLPEKSNESYIDRLKKKLAEEEKKSESPGSYSDQEKLKLPSDAERESPITVVKEGRDHKLGFGDTPDIHNAGGFKLGVTPGMQVTVEGGTHTFADVYGTGFQPELVFHYERQFFHSENFGSLGVGTDFGLAYSGGKGLLQFTFNGSNASQTGFSFIQVPVLINAIYRFNLLRIIRPYISVGAGAMFYSEIREDTKGDKRGYSAVYNGSVGTSFLLDFLDSKTRTDSYLSNGIQHTYLFVEYLYLNTFKSSVAFKRAGIYSGFLFEF